MRKTYLCDINMILQHLIESIYIKRKVGGTIGYEEKITYFSKIKNLTNASLFLGEGVQEFRGVTKKYFQKILDTSNINIIKMIRRVIL